MRSGINHRNLMPTRSTKIGAPILVEIKQLLTECGWTKVFVEIIDGKMHKKETWQLEGESSTYKKVKHFFAFLTYKYCTPEFIKSQDAHDKAIEKEFERIAGNSKNVKHIK